MKNILLFLYHVFVKIMNLLGNCVNEFKRIPKQVRQEENCISNFQSMKALLVGRSEVNLCRDRE